MSERVALTTLTVGQACIDYWNTWCRPNWTAYAERHGFELVVLERALDTSFRAATRQISWQKCLVLEQPELEGFDRVVWIDADIVINAARAPSIVSGVPREKVAGVVSAGYVHDDMRAVFLERERGIVGDPDGDRERWEADQRQWYYGLDAGTSDILQGGVFVVSPEHHRELLLDVYEGDFPPKLYPYEQAPLSFAVYSEGLFHRLNTRFNLVFYERMVVHYPYLRDRSLPHFEELAYHAVQTELANSWFLHFAYSQVRDLVRFTTPPQR
jgi:hypothetical protein